MDQEVPHQSSIKISQSESSTELPSDDPESILFFDGQSRDLLSLIADNTLRMSKREMPAYWDLVRRSGSVPFQKLQESATSEIRFNDFFREPEKHRGGLFLLDIVVRRVNRYEAEAGNSAHVSAVYEIWGTTEQSQSWLYVFIADSLPTGYSEETLVRKNVRFAGYFLKLLAYQPGNAPPNAKPLLAPMLVGQLNEFSPSGQHAKRDASQWPTFGLGAVVVLVSSYFSLRLFWKSKSSKNIRVVPQINPDDFDFDAKKSS